mgnify:CR=1 FL=1
MTAYSAAMQVVHNEADADDIAQETMVKLYLNIDALDEDRVEGWVRVAAKNLGIDYQRKAQRFDWNELDEDLRAEEMELPTLAEEEKQERNHFFREVMDALKDHDESGYYDVGVKTINKFNPIPYSTLKNSYFVVYRRGLGNI